jgi:hypothetical protein
VDPADAPSTARSSWPTGEGVGGRALHERGWRKAGLGGVCCHVTWAQLKERAGAAGVSELRAQSDPAVASDQTTASMCHLTERESREVTY